MIRAALGILLFLAVAGNAKHWPVHISGEVSAGKVFQRDVGQDLVFRLHPTGTGWEMGIFPKTKCPDDNWAMVVNAPYRGYNALYLDASHGVSAKQAIAMSPRQFSFVLSCEDYQLELLRLNKILWPYTYSKEEVDEATANLSSSPQGTAKLLVVAARVGASESAPIEWLKFTVDIRTPQ